MVSKPFPAQERRLKAVTLAVAGRAEMPSTASRADAYRYCASALTHHFRNSHAFSTFWLSLRMTQPVPPPAEELSIVPSSFSMPGISDISQRPVISGAATLSMAYWSYVAMAIGISPVRNRVEKS